MAHAYDAMEQYHLSLRRELLKLSKPKLIKKCKSATLSTNGSKSDMIDRIIKHQYKSKNHDVKSPPNLTKRSKGSQSVRASNKHYGKHGKRMSLPLGSSFIPKPITPRKKREMFIDEFQLKPTKVNKIQHKRKESIKKLSKKTRKSHNYTVYGCGGNTFGEFGLNNTESTPELITIHKGNMKTKNISSIHNGYQYTIYNDHKLNKFYSSGYNTHGQCGFNPYKNNQSEWILKHKSIEFFNKKSIKIQKLCTNIGSSATFWITKKGKKVYGHGRNDSYQLGLGHNKNINKPTLIKHLSTANIVDIQSAASYSVALSSIDKSIKTIINYWLISNHIDTRQVPKHTIDEIIRYGSHNQVYATQHSFFGGDGHGPKTTNDGDKFLIKLGMNNVSSGEEQKEKEKERETEDDVKKTEQELEKEKFQRNTWKKLDCFGLNHKIIKIATGSEHTLFLEDNGNVWCCGDNAFGQLGIGFDDEDEDNGTGDITPVSNASKDGNDNACIYRPQIIEWFVTNNINIIDIECGLYHNLAIDIEGRIYSWGHAKRGQCGNGEDDIEIEYVDIPQLIEWFPIYNLKGINIKCGNYHSLVKTSNNKYWLFGSNQCNQCLTFDGKSKIIMPNCVNKIIQEKTGKKYIKDLYLGCNNTKVIVY